MSDPSHSIRIPEEWIEMILEITGEEEKAPAVRKLLWHSINCPNYIRDDKIKIIDIEQYLTVKQVAAMQGVSLRTVYGWIEKDLLTTIRRGKKGYLVDKESLTKLIMENNKPKIKRIEIN